MDQLRHWLRAINDRFGRKPSHEGSGDRSMQAKPAVGDGIGGGGTATALATGAQIGEIPGALLEFQSPTAAVIATPIPASSRYTGLVVTVMVLLLLIIASVVKVSKVVTAPGRLVSTAPTIMLQPFNTSIVQAVYVHEGEIVRKGQLLAKLNPTYARADLTALRSQVVALSAEQARLEAEANGATYAPAHPSPAPPPARCAPARCRPNNIPRSEIARQAALLQQQSRTKQWPASSHAPPPPRSHG